MKYLQENKDNNSMLIGKLYLNLCTRLIYSITQQVPDSLRTNELIPGLYINIPSSWYSLHSLV